MPRDGATQIRDPGVVVGMSLTGHSCRKRIVLLPKVNAAMQKNPLARVNLPKNPALRREIQQEIQRFGSIFSQIVPIAPRRHARIRDM